MTIERDLALIREFAATGKYRENAIQAHRARLRFDKYLETDECQFMREVDNEVPDLALRAHYRRNILENHDER